MNLVKSVRGVSRGSPLFWLFAATSLIVTYLRHGLETHWQQWATWEDFFTEVFVHCMALGLFLAFGGGLTLHFKKRFCGGEDNITTENTIYFMLMTLLLASLAIIFLHFGSPFSSPED